MEEELKTKSELIYRWRRRWRTARWRRWWRGGGGRGGGSPAVAAGDRPPSVAAAVGDRPVAAVVEGRRRPRRWGGVCGVCVKVGNDLREKRLVECFCLPSA